jgi:hypothetical protein
MAAEYFCDFRDSSHWPEVSSIRRANEIQKYAALAFRRRQSDAPEPQRLQLPSSQENAVGSGRAARVKTAAIAVGNQHYRTIRAAAVRPSTDGAFPRTGERRRRDGGLVIVGFAAGETRLLSGMNDAAPKRPVIDRTTVR